MPWLANTASFQGGNHLGQGPCFSVSKGMVQAGVPPLCSSWSNSPGFFSRVLWRKMLEIPGNEVYPRTTVLGASPCRHSPVREMREFSGSSAEVISRPGPGIKADSDWAKTALTRSHSPTMSTFLQILARKNTGIGWNWMASFQELNQQFFHSFNLSSPVAPQLVSGHPSLRFQHGTLVTPPGDDLVWNCVVRRAIDSFKSFALRDKLPNG